MAFNINSFISNMKYDGFRPNLFEVQITFPSTTASTAQIQQFTFKGRASAIPASSIGVAQVPYFGRNAKFAGNRVFENWQVNVVMDEDDFFFTGVRGMFERWMSKINRHEQNYRDPQYVPPNQDGYFGEGMVIPYAKQGKQLNATYFMKGCYPIDIGAMPLDWGDNDRVAEFPVTFAYQWWSSSAAYD